MSKRSIKITIITFVFVIVAVLVFYNYNKGGDFNVENSTTKVVDIQETDNDTKIISCDGIAEQSQCIEYVGSGWTDEGAARSCSCPLTEISHEPCPRENLIGECQVTRGMGDLAYSIFNYTIGGSPDDHPDFKEICVKAGNKFIEPENK